MKQEITCPHCEDKWNYLFTVDHENGTTIVTTDFKFIENWETCTCYNCHKIYKPEGETNLKMYDFVYRAWRNTKM